ncbi:MAG: aminomethyl-transferring glycine dehydrogenase subunit GcvPA [Alphaproteobacteria bacterium]
MRYLPLSEKDREEMLAKIGASSIDDLFKDVPKAALVKDNTHTAIDLPFGLSEIEVSKELSKMAAKNLCLCKASSFLGAGAYHHHTPAALDYLIQRGEFLTAYTPYQPEVSQGTLQVLYEFQTQVAAITGMEIANASMYDGATACAEAIAMACRITKKTKAVVSGNLHPHYIETSTTFVKHIGISFDIGKPFETKVDLLSKIKADTACVVVAYPDFLGSLEDYTDVAAKCHEVGALLIGVFTEPLAFGYIKTLGSMGADVVVGEGLSLCAGLSFGAPGVGLFATLKKYMRHIPGRIVGQTKDADGKRGFVLTLATREQHIRREKATSNICSNSGLMATAFSIHMTMLGEKGYYELAKLNHKLTSYLVSKLKSLANLKVLNKSFFNEIAVELSKPAEEAVANLLDKDIFAGVPLSRFYKEESLENVLLIAVTEMNSEEEIDNFVSKLERL